MSFQFREPYEICVMVKLLNYAFIVNVYSLKYNRWTNKVLELAGSMIVHIPATCRDYCKCNSKHWTFPSSRQWM